MVENATIIISAANSQKLNIGMAAIISIYGDAT